MIQNKLKYQDITREILGAAFEVHNILGCGFLEKVYENALERELKARKLNYDSQKEINVFYKNQKVGTYIPDLVIEDKVIVELKVVGEIGNIHIAQLLNYLKASGYEVGLILNFAKTKLEYKRLIK
ncbi:MAG: GxxExxY protein [Planctomycetota bacterium]